MNDPKAYLAVRDLGNGVKVEEVVKESEAEAARSAGYTLTPLVPVSGEPVGTRIDPSRLALFARATRHPVVLEIMADYAGCIDVESDAMRDSDEPSDDKWLALAAQLRRDAASIRAEDPEIWIDNTTSALSATQAEVKRLREALELAKRELLVCQHNAAKGHVCFDGDEFHEALSAVKAALSTPADTSEYDRLVADAGRYRVLRDDSYQIDEDDICVSDAFFNTYFGEELDAAVDALAARAEVKS